MGNANAIKHSTTFTTTEPETTSKNNFEEEETSSSYSYEYDQGSSFDENEEPFQEVSSSSDE